MKISLTNSEVEGLVNSVNFILTINKDDKTIDYHFNFDLNRSSSKKLKLNEMLVINDILDKHIREVMDPVSKELSKSIEDNNSFDIQNEFITIFLEKQEEIIENICNQNIKKNTEQLKSMINKLK